MVEVKITYDTLFDLFRREKSRTELQSLDKSFYSDVISYIKEKKGTLRDEDHHTMLFPKSEQEKIKIQIKNIQKIIRELYEIREKKIINLAVNKVRTESNLIDTSNLLPEEIGLFNEVCEVLSKYKKGLLNQVLRMENPTIATVNEMYNSKMSMSKEYFENEASEQNHTNHINQMEDKSIFSAHTNSPAKTEYSSTEFHNLDSQSTDEEVSSSSKLTSTNNSNSKKVKILNDLPKFLGQDKNIYGPFKKNEIVDLPNNLIEILAKKGRVEIIN